MISQRCPKCKSRKVRRGYQKTPILMKLFFRYYLLCDNCNWEFTGFAVPGTVTAKPRRVKKKDKIANQISKTEENEVKFETREVLNSPNRKRVKNKVKVKFQ